MEGSSETIVMDDQCTRNEWTLLRDVYKLLATQNVFCNDPQQWNTQKITDFLPPDVLKQRINLKIEENEVNSISELEKICRLVIQYSVKTSHGRFHNQLFGQVDPFGIAGAWITEALNTSSYTYEMSPVFSLIESEVISTICRLAEYENGHGDGIFTPGGSLANMYAIVLARYKRWPEIKASGVFGMAPITIFTSEESHYSLKKAAHWLGLGVNNCIAVKTNKRGQMCIEDLESKILMAKASGSEPLLVNATAGTTVLGAFDDLVGIADISERYGLWLHVDACLGGAVLLSKIHKTLIRGITKANSFAWNPHKTLGAPLQCSLFITREANLLSVCNSTEVDYLFQQDKFYDVSYDTGNKSVQCGRKVDAFKLWLMFKARGYGEYGRLVDNAFSMARLLEKKILERSDRFRLVLDRHQYSNVCFWYIPSIMRGCEETDEWWTRLYTVAPKIKEKMSYSGTIMIGYSPLGNKKLGNFFRMVFTCFPCLNANEVNFIIDEIERLGELCSY